MPLFRFHDLHHNARTSPPRLVVSRRTSTPNNRPSWEDVRLQRVTNRTRSGMGNGLATNEFAFARASTTIAADPGGGPSGAPQVHPAREDLLWSVRARGRESRRGS